MADAAQKGERILRGIPVSSGVSRGKILVIGRPDHSIPRREVPGDKLAEELNRLEQALILTRHQILDVQKKVSTSMGAEEGGIFDAHLLVLEDRTLIDEVTRLIQSEKVNAEHAFHTIGEKYAKTLETIGDEYLRERATDMRDVAQRVLNNLLGQGQHIDLHHLQVSASSSATT